MISIAAPQIGKEEQLAVANVLSSGQLAQGTTVAEFEKLFATYVDTGYAVAVSSGTAALELALRAHGIGPGDEVITTPFSFAATANTIISVGGTPVFVDIDPQTFCIDPNLIPGAISPKTRAIMPVHLFGHPAEIELISDIANKHGLVLIEDAAQAHGARLNSRNVGSFGTGCFSFYPTKNMTTGEGGIVTTNDPEIARRINLLRNHGMNERYSYEMLGYNLRMSEISAAIGIAQIAKLESFNEKRRHNATELSSRLLDDISTPVEPSNGRHVFNQYTIRIPENRGRVADQLREHQVGTSVYYPSTLSDLPHLADTGSYPEAERACREVLSLPVHPGLNSADLTTIINSTNSVIGSI